MPSKKQLDARRKRNAKFWKQRAGKDQARRNPKIMAVCPGTTVFVETSAWEPALGMLFENAGAGKWTIVCLLTSGLHVTERSPMGKHMCVLA